MELQGSEEFFKAVKFNQLFLVEEALKINPKYSEQNDYYLQTPLHWAAKLGYIEMIQLLLKCTTQCNRYDRKMRTPLYFAALYNQKKCVELLINNGGNPHLEDENGNKPENVTDDYGINVILKNVPDKKFFEINKKSKIDNDNDEINDINNNNFNKK